MFAGVILALAAGAAWPFDQVVCPPKPRQAAVFRTAASPDPMRWRYIETVPTFATKVRDVMRFPARTGEAWRATHAGGAGNGYFSVIDTRARIGNVHTYVSYRCGYDDTLREFEIFAYPGIPQGPLKTPAATRTIAWRSGLGIALGDNFEQVRLIYGNAALQRVNGADVLAYEERRLIPGTRTLGVVKTTFIFRNGFLIGIFRTAGV